MSEPVRLQLNSLEGFDLQAESRARNGLLAVNVARPSKWGNPYRVILDGKICRLTRPHSHEIFYSLASERDAAKSAAYQYLLWLRAKPPQREFFAKHVIEIRGHNLACLCPLPTPGEPDHCHAAVLLRLANVRCEAPPSPNAGDGTQPSGEKGGGR